ncbi:hypothetical protein M0R45_012751 [Rubus argutus]|uniref:Uncharacterized protein n=1 Tax=Rubus argutus TaxID=59490 RepID=A0AAW1XJ67_RUBAR
MVREISKDDAVVVRSSIALLQERFRELQRVKAMREQREGPTVTVTDTSSSSSVDTCSSNKLETSDSDSADVDTSLHL